LELVPSRCSSSLRPRLARGPSSHVVASALIGARAPLRAQALPYLVTRSTGGESSYGGMERLKKQGSRKKKNI
jgi:hypothetical protein